MRKQFVSIGGFISPKSPLLHGVPQGSVLGPLLFVINIVPLSHIIQHYGLNFHCYADDTQIYIHTKPSHTIPLSSLVNSLNAVNNWMVQNFLKLNQDKTKAIFISTPDILRKLEHLQPPTPGYFTSTTAKVRQLCVSLDSSFDSQASLKQPSFA